MEARSEDGVTHARVALHTYLYAAGRDANPRVTVDIIDLVTNLLHLLDSESRELCGLERPAHSTAEHSTPSSTITSLSRGMTLNRL